MTPIAQATPAMQTQILAFRINALTTARTAWRPLSIAAVVSVRLADSARPAETMTPIAQATPATPSQIYVFRTSALTTVGMAQRRISIAAVVRVRLAQSGKNA